MACMGTARYIKKYGIWVEPEEWWHPLRQTYCTTYIIYTADGCCWDKGLSYKGVQNECKKYADTFIEIKNGVAKKGV